MFLPRPAGQNTPVGTAAIEYTETFQRFHAAVEDDYARARDVGHYAHSLGCAPRTLTRATLAAAGVGAEEFVDRGLVLEARRPLTQGGEPVSGLAARLGFLDTSDFVQYYTQRTSSTPTAFRNRFRADRSG